MNNNKIKALWVLCCASVLAAQSGPFETKPVHPAQPLRLYKAAFDSVTAFDVTHYRLDLSFPFETSYFTGRVTLDVRIMEDLSRLDLHMGDLTVEQILADGETCTWLREGEDLLVELPVRADAGDSVRIEIGYHGAPDERGFYFYDRCAYTMSEPTDARYWFPCRDVPWDKATADVFVTVPRGVEAASNGLLQSRRLSADGRYETFHWASRHPMATYLFCVTLSDEYARWSDWYVNAAGDSIEMPYYVFREDSLAALEDVKNMIDAMTFFAERFGPYPFDKYGTAAVTPFAFGGMEHQGMTTVNKTWFRGNRRYEGGFIHELAHMWWGDAITLSDWHSIWLNEGFATYSQVLAFEHLYGPDLLKSETRGLQSAYRDQASRQDWPIYNPSMNQLFNWGISYAKGACVLHMLRWVVGEEGFWRILPQYYATYRYGNASISDFQTVCEQVSGQSLGWFFTQWIYRDGYPRLNYNGSHVLTTYQQRVLNLSLRQTQDQPPFRMPVPLRLETAAGKIDTTIWVDAREQLIRIAVPDSVTGIVFDPDGWVILDAQRVPGFSVPSAGSPAALRAAPNPAPGSLTFYIQLPDDFMQWSVHLDVYDAAGRHVRSFREAALSPGEHTLFWDGLTDRGQAAASGVYLARLRAEDRVISHKIVLIR